MDYNDQQSKNGKKGGLTTKKLHGIKHFSRAGKKSAEKRFGKKK